ncbi:vWA domain-containing protein [Nucisporomicrobium flavum]|uniref:vWA domain-containing protein n=1 Tax=Nucisporomicrobium flavum TaxID=2785915 RepID=UPI0018F6C94E|nr:vWA domain-containing protein [Nucisporomicrobium flavum]
MAYTAEISRSNPSCFIFLIDQSTSMLDEITEGELVRRKADVVADALNRLLRELAVKCAKEGGVRDYFHVAVIGYGVHVGSLLEGELAGRDLVPLSQVAKYPARVEERTKKVPDGAGGLVEQPTKFPVWVDPVGNGGTPMVEALRQATVLANTFLATNENCFPPVVLNLTDGQATDGDPRPAAEAVRELASTDGNVLLFNLHVSSEGGTPTIFPGASAELNDEYARTLFSMSSPLPPHMRAYAAQQGIAVDGTSRGFVYNADMITVVQFLDIGTRATDLR